MQPWTITNGAVFIEIHNITQTNTVITTPFAFNPVELLDLITQEFVTNNIKVKI